MDWETYTFCVAAPCVWNGLSRDVTASRDLAAFRRPLKTRRLFTVSFTPPSDCFKPFVSYGFKLYSVLAVS